MSGGFPRPSRSSLRRARVDAWSRTRGPLPWSRRVPLSATPWGVAHWLARCLARRAHQPSSGGAEGAPLGLVRAAFLRLRRLPRSCSCLPLFLCPPPPGGLAARPRGRPWRCAGRPRRRPLGAWALNLLVRSTLNPLGTKVPKP